MPFQVSPGGQPARESDGARVPVRGDPVDVRATRVGQLQHSSDLVEGLPRCVVQGGAQRLHVLGDVPDQQQVRVSAADEQGDEWLGQRPVLKCVHRDMSGEMVDPVERLVESQRQCFGRCDAHHERTGQPGTGRHRDGVNIGETDPGLVAGALDGGHHGLQVCPAGHLRHHPAEACVLVNAASDRVGQQRAAADDAHPRLIATALHAQHQRFVLSHPRQAPCA